MADTASAKRCSGRNIRFRVPQTVSWARLTSPTQIKNLIIFLDADMAELADAHGSGPCESDFMQVQVLLSAPKKASF